MHLNSRCLVLIALWGFLVTGNPSKENAPPPLSDDTIRSSLDQLKTSRAGRDGPFRSEKSNPKAALDCSFLDPAKVEEIQGYQTLVNDFINLFVTGAFKGATYDLVAYVTDTYGPRMTGSQALEDVIDWFVAQATTEGFNVYTESFTAPHWVRNKETLELLVPDNRNLAVVGLGTSVGTPPAGITAEVLVVNSFDDLQANAANAAGKIILYDVPFTTYGETVQYRGEGAIEAAKVGGVASLIRSITDFSLYTPHTGHVNYDNDVQQIPAGAITIEDSTMLHRMQDRGETIVVTLTMNDAILPDITVRNTVIDIEGIQYPEQVVLVSGHMDSWDLGTGAMDDAAGCIISYMASRAVHQLNLTPRRTFRTVFFSAEEQGIIGGDAYFLAHAAESRNFQLVMESDFGTFNPRGIGFDGTDEATCIIQEIVSMTGLIGTTEVSEVDISDLGGFNLVGVPTGNLATDNEKYFWYHHSPADRMEVEDSDTLDKISALWAAVAYVAADITFQIPHNNITQFN